MSDREEFECALHEGASDQPPESVVLSAAVTWGKLIAFALRQPNLATALGLMGQTTVTPEDPTFFEKGGWLFLDLHATSAYAGIADFVARYAARIPPLTDGRPIFAAVLFPVDGGAGTFVADDGLTCSPRPSTSETGASSMPCTPQLRHLHNIISCMTEYK